MPSATRNILIGLGLGLLVGVSLGERAAILQFAADGYLRLLQMTVLPYIMVSLVTGIGSLDPRRARDLFLKVGALTLVLWSLSLAVVFVMPLGFPAIQTASFFSTTLVEEPVPLDFIALYIPANPFQSLANSIVPAVVLFSAFLGAALIGIETKEPLLGSLQVIERMLARANRFAVRLTPFGLFAIAAVTMGTADTEQMGRLQVFLFGYAAMSLLLALWILPGLVACLTPIPVRRILHSTRDALITAFITGELFIVLPALIEGSKKLLEEYGLPVDRPGAADGEATRVQGAYLRDVLAHNRSQKNFRVFSPDETASNRWNAVFEVTNRASVAEIVPGKKKLCVPCGLCGENCRHKLKRGRTGRPLFFVRVRSGLALLAGLLLPALGFLCHFFYPPLRVGLICANAPRADAVAAAWHAHPTLDARRFVAPSAPYRMVQVRKGEAETPTSLGVA